jgi:hypothetical protein
MEKLQKIQTLKSSPKYKDELHQLFLSLFEQVVSVAPNESTLVIASNIWNKNERYFYLALALDLDVEEFKGGYKGEKNVYKEEISEDERALVEDLMMLELDDYWVRQKLANLCREIEGV